MPKSASRYAAFISYRHKPRDRQWALRIMQALETYRTPPALKAEAFPDRIGTLFRDEDEIPASTDLSDQIKEALRQSDFLIVVCSPDTPGSRWVRREIELFQEMGKGERILPLLIAGEPEESFPPELLRRRAERPRADGSIEHEWEEVEPIAADVRPRQDERKAKTEQRALLRLAAALLGCRYDDLARRDAERRRTRLRNLAAAATVILLAAGGSGTWWWDAKLRIKTQYCANYAERWGVPLCVGPIEGDAPLRRAATYRMLTRGGQVLELARINGSGHLKADSETLYEGEDWTAGVARWVYGYRSEGRADGPMLASVVLFSGTGQRLRGIEFQFADDRRQAIARFDKNLGVAERQLASGMSLSAATPSPSREFEGRSAIGQHRLFFDTRGLLVKRTFEPVGGGGSRSDALGAHGRAYEHGSAGLVSAIRNLDQSGDTLVDKIGVAELHRVFDAHGSLVAVEWRNAHRAPTANEQAFARIAYARDDFGNVRQIDYLDANGAPVLRKDWGLAHLIRRHDERGNMIEASYLDVGGRPILRNDWAVARMTWRYDERGDNLEEAYFGVDGRPILRKDSGVARMTMRRDERRNLVELAVFGVDGQPILHKEIGLARASVRYDERGNVVEERYLGTDGRPILTRNRGSARLTLRHDEHGNIVEAADFGVDDRPILRKDWGIARVTVRRDERGNLVEMRLFGLDGQPIVRKDWGVARVTFGFDERGNEIEQAYFGTDGRPALRKDWGVARRASQYDEHGNEVEESYLGTDGQPILRKDLGVARTTSRFDERGHRIEQAYFGTDGRPILRKDWGVARMTFRFDERGNTAEAAYFGSGGQPVLRTDWGVAGATFRHDLRGKNVETFFFGVDRRPILHKLWRITRVAAQYDDRGNSLEEAYFGIDGEPVLAAIGAARLSTRYDERSNPIEAAYFGVDGQPILRADTGVARSTLRYDERGNAIEAANFGTDGQPILSKDWGVARTTRRADEHGGNIEEAYFGLDGRPILRKDLGTARQSWRRDERGAIAEESFFDTNDRLAANLFGFARGESRRDGLDRLVEQRYFDPAGNPVLRANRLRKDEEIKDIFGQWSQLVLSGALDKAALATIGQGGFARIVQEFDPRGDATRRAFFGPNDEPVAGLNGFSDERVEYDALGRPILLQPTLGGAASASITSIWTRLTYDAAGEVTRIDYVNPEGGAVDGKQGFASIVIERRPDGSGTRTVFKNAEDKVIAEQ